MKRVFGILTIIIGLVTLTFVEARPKAKGPRRWRPETRRPHSKRTYEVPGAPAVTAPYPNIWSALSNDEAASVIQFLHCQPELNLTAAANATSWDNQITVVDTLTPNKTDVLPFLTGEGPEPERWAKAVLMFGATDEPYIQDFAVGPLPVSEQTTYSPLNYASTKGIAMQRDYDADQDLTYELMTNISTSISDILLDLLNGTAYGYDNDTLTIWGIDPIWHEDGRIVQWVQYWAIPQTIFDGETLLPEGLYFKIDTTGRDPSGWGLIGWLYNGVYYNSTEAFRAAWSSPGFEKLLPNVEGSWISTDFTGEALPYEEQPPPMLIQPDGQPRFAVDTGAQYIEWMDFSFYISFNRDTGMRLYNVEYKGDRILYEIGLEEAIAHYAGNDPVQSGTAYLDSFYGFGPYAFELLPGYDCPVYATFLNSTFHVTELSKTHPGSICVFEADMTYLIQRHSNMNYLSTTKNIALIVRSVSTVGNYDYNFDYTFYLDGSVEVTVRASGYIQSAYYAQNEGYGYRIHDSLSGSMHDHCLNFKADIDILGTANSFAQHAIVPVDVKYPWSNTTRSTMQLQRSYLASEDESKLVRLFPITLVHLTSYATKMWPDNNQVFYIVENQNATNKYGEPRGYRIMPSSGGGMRLTIQNSSNLINSQNFATHQLYVTKQKDTEPRAAHANNDYDVANPIVDFNAFFNGESLEQEDLVLWFNLGMHHVPHTGDLPNTVFTTAQSSVVITPHNYLEMDPSRQSRQQVRVDYSNTDGVTDVETFGAEFPEGTFDLSSQQPDFYAYEGDIAVRKFPYDPTHPFNDTESIV
ncbi:hypothetical protein JAAARDRAFT_191806 [Jaapia argillacea MUCL 33604]|uniref:Amine oxidase n=1 Tax=Jaapia argillacea MUCL 33604 TaxID=933084 RepID=A0A067QAB3_9AGAM|nr:hypothetical protein JAAARDRAFT_191806 [Jaapia argillacea MUCL 33604]